MRQHLGIALCGVLAVGGVGRAYADKGPKKPKPIDIKPMVDKVDVYRDDTGFVLVTPKPGEIQHGSSDQLENWVFYGNGKTLYQQRVVGTAVNALKFAWVLWSPRVKGIPHAIVDSDATGVQVHCSKTNDGDQRLAPVPPDQAKALLAKATFLPPLWQRSAQFLARDDDGVYFFVDVLREEYGGKGYRVFMGKKGLMKELAMTNVVSDTGGEIYATKTGELKIVAGSDGKAFWRKGGKKTELIVLELQDNRYLIYRELGIYGSLGVVCDDT